MPSSEAITQGVRVRAVSEFDPERSAPGRGQWFFRYTITISNEGTGNVQLLSRHWIITDASGHVEEVKGPGVVGQQPVIPPGQAFEYSSGCPLATPVGSMHGSYQMALEGGGRFDAAIAPFTLSEPHAIN